MQNESIPQLEIMPQLWVADRPESGAAIDTSDEVLQNAHHFLLLAGIGLYILGCLDRAFEGVEILLAGVLRKAKFWRGHTGLPLNYRQKFVLNKVLDGFEGKLTSTKWAKLTKCSQDTATRDINDLVSRGILLKEAAGGRSTNYSVFEEGKGWY